MTKGEILCLQIEMMNCKCGKDEGECCLCCQQDVRCITPAVCVKGACQIMCCDGRCALPCDPEEVS